MAEQTFRSPGFFEQEIELVPGVAGPQGIPAGVIAPAEKGPAFVPVTVGNFEDFLAKFGGLDPEIQGPYAAREWLKNKGALTYLRVLGAGANKTQADITTTIADGTVKSAGFKLTPTEVTIAGGAKASVGGVQFLAARHYVSASGGPREEVAFPIITDNPSFRARLGETEANMIRGVLFTTNESRIQVLNPNEVWGPGKDDKAFMGLDGTSSTARTFKIVISSSNSTWSQTYSDDGYAGIRIMTASFDPREDTYVGRILNTDPDLFYTHQHLLYIDMPVDIEIAPVNPGSNGDETVAILSGSGAFNQKFGRYDTRYTTPRTTSFISQPFGKFEYDLFHFESISDGAWANDKIKVSIANLIASTDKSRPYGTFDVLIRKFSDDDVDVETLERYSKLTLDPRSENYIAKVIGDKKVQYNFDADDQDERRLLITGKYPNKSPRVRVVMNPAIERGEIPAESLPFGFRGIPVLKTSDSLFDGTGNLSFEGKSFSEGFRLWGRTVTSGLTGSLVPPLPYRFKTTRGATSETEGNVGAPGTNERADSRFFWGVVGTSIPSTSSFPNAILNANAGALPSKLIDAYTKFQGIANQDVLVTGSAADVLNANKFTLARVSFYNNSFTDITGTAEQHIVGAAYVRNGEISDSQYRVSYGGSDRVTMATLVHSSSIVFNRFSNYAKFTNIFYGGFDGLNILDRDNRKMNDKASSTETSSAANGGNGKALGAVESGLTTNAAGIGIENNIIAAYRAGVDIMTDSFSSNINVLTIPGIRDPLVTNYASDKIRDYSLAVYLQDIPGYDDSGYRLWEDSSGRPSVRYTSENFISRNLDNNYVASYFPDIFIEGDENLRRVKVGASIASLSAIAFNDRVSYPWFAPAGFNRAALDFVVNTAVRLNSPDRDVLYDARINPIAVFPRGGYVIFGQKTLQLAKSSLDRVNVRRLVIEVKRIIAAQANRILFEQNTPEVRTKFVSSTVPQLALIQAQAGIERFSVIMDDTNNTQADIDANRVNGRIVIVPTRTVEFIAVDFVITSSGIQFV